MSMNEEIKDVFVYPIEREITPVIKVEDERNIAQELEEYVVTDKIEENIIKFFENYNETALKESDKVGVWISGFFGCGKSHFAKILGYLLENKQIGDRLASEIFLERIKGSKREKDIKALLHQMSTNIKSHVIMFQIKSEEDQLEKKSISKTIYQQFLRYLGLSEDIHIAELEQDLIREGKYDEFKEKIKNIKGKEWVEVRESKLFAKKPIGQALFELGIGKSEEDAIKNFDELKEKIELSVSKLTKKITNHIKTLQEKHESTPPHIVFIIDEIGQYIGASDDLLLELQSIVEQFGPIGQGKIWLIVTAQEKLNEIIEGVGSKKTTYAKIMDRFDTKLHLTSDNIVKVLEERILKKKEQVKPNISNIYSNYSGTITFASKIEGANRPIIECQEPNFISSYPFLPHQLQLTQDIFTNIRREAGHLGKLTGTERSMLGVTQAILKSPATGFKDASLGRLVTFDEIFDQITVEIPPDTYKNIDQIKIKLPQDPNIVKRTLKTLYLMQQIDWIPKTIDNITKGLVNNVGINVTEHQTLIDNALKELIKGKYVICENKQYEYISGAKKLIEEEISQEQIKPHDEKRYAKRTLRTIVDSSKLNRIDYEGVTYFDVRTFGDDEEYHTKGEVSLKVYSPIFYKYGNVDKDSKINESYKDTHTIYWLPDTDTDVMPSVSKYLRTQKVVERHEKSGAKSPEGVELLREKQVGIDNMKSNLEKMLKRALLTGTIIYDGNAEELDGKSDNLKVVFEREVSKIIPHIYPRFEDAKIKVSEKSIQSILTSKSPDLHTIEKGLNLFDTKGDINLHGKVINDIYNAIKTACDKGEELNGGKITEIFNTIPYHWDVILVRIVLAALFRSGSIYLKHEGKEFVDYKKSDAKDLLMKTNLFKKTYLLYEIEGAVSLQERKVIQQHLNVIFDLKCDDTIPTLSKNIEERLSAMKQEFGTQKIYWEQNDYKLKNIFYKIDELCDTILGIARASKKLKCFLENVNDIKNAHDYQIKVQKFMEGGDSAIPRRVRNLPTTLTVNSIQVDESIKQEYDTNKKEIDTIVMNKEIVDKWPTVLMNYNKAMTKFKEVYQTLHETRYKIYNKMKEEISSISQYKNLIKEDTFAPIKTYLCEKEYKWSSEHLKCISCGCSISELDSHILAEGKKRDMILARLTPKKPTPGMPVPIYINLKSIVQKTVIKNKKDMDVAVENIKKKIKEQLDKGNTVILE